MRGLTAAGVFGDSETAAIGSFGSLCRRKVAGLCRLLAIFLGQRIARRRLCQNLGRLRGAVAVERGLPINTGQRVDAGLNRGYTLGLGCLSRKSLRFQFDLGTQTRLPVCCCNRGRAELLQGRAAVVQPGFVGSNRR